MDRISNLMSQATAGFAALALSLVAISATVAPVDFATPPVATQEIVA